MTLLRPATLAVALVAIAPLVSPAAIRAQSGNAEARAHFDAGNRHFARARRVRGARRTRALEEALGEYMQTLAIVRSRNALFNTALVLEQLERPTEAFGYVREYLAIRGLSDQERADGEARMAALREKVAVIATASEPAGAEVFVDRLDLAARGSAPIEIAVEPGEHTLYFRLPHHETAERTVEAATGERTEVSVTLAPEPVAVTLEVMAPAATPLTLDGEPAEAGTVELAPGLHVARLEPTEGTPVERRFEVRPGEPMRVRLELSAPAVARVETGTIRVVSNVAAQVFVDDAPVGEGEEVTTEASTGSHVVEVRVEGRDPLRRLVRLRAGGTAELQASFDEESRPLGVLPHVALGLTGAGLAATVGLGVRALQMNDDNQALCDATPSRCDQLEAEVEDANRVTDVVLGVTGALAITTLILYLVNRPDADGDLVQLVAGPGGAGVQLGGRF
jgi:outer membrane receptor for ferrienterochelin and colicins